MKYFIRISIALSFASVLSCDKYEEDAPRSLVKYCGKYLGVEEYIKQGVSCGYTYSKYEAVYEVKLGKTPGTINLGGKDLAIKSEGRYDEFGYSLSFNSDSLFCARDIDGVSCNSKSTFYGKKIK